MSARRGSWSLLRPKVQEARSQWRLISERSYLTISEKRFWCLVTGPTMTQDFSFPCLFVCLFDSNPTVC